MTAFVNHDVVVDNDVPLVLETPNEEGKGVRVEHRPRPGNPRE